MMNKRKLIMIILSVFLVVSIGANIYQFNANQSLKTSVAGLQNELDNLNAEIASLKNDISEKDTKIAELEKTIEDLNTTIEKEDYTVTDVDIQMLVTQQAFTYESPSSSSLKIGAVQKDEVVHVIGQVDNTNWFKISQEGDIYSFIDGTLLVEMTEEQSKEYEQYLEEVVQTQQEQPQQSEQPVQQPEVQQPAVEIPENEQPEEGEAPLPRDENGNYTPINPETGQPYEVGDIVGGFIWSGDDSNNPYW